MKRKEIILNRYKTIGEEVEFLNMAIKVLEEQIEPGGELALANDTGDIHTTISQIKYG